MPKILHVDSSVNEYLFELVGKNDNKQLPVPVGGSPVTCCFCRQRRGTSGNGSVYGTRLEV